VLVIGAGSGQEVFQMTSYYNDVEIAALDYSLNNIAYAVRQLKELGKEDCAKFIYANYELYEPKEGELYDYVVANNCLHYRDEEVVISEDVTGRHMNLLLENRLKKIATFVKPGGIIKVSVAAHRFVKIIKKTRELMHKLRSEVDVFKALPAFGDPSNYYQILSIPSLDECRLARNAILNISNEEVKDFEELRELFNSPGFFALHEFADLVYNPKIWGYSYESVGNAIKKTDLKLVGFEFPGLTQDAYLRYKVEHPDDPEMLNYQHLETFSTENPDAFKNLNYSINFVLEKPL
jgi:SAM-dependent methyltransferase